MTPWLAPIVDNFRNQFGDLTYFDMMMEKGVIDVFKDNEYISKTGYNLQRKGLVITKILPENLKID